MTQQEAYEKAVSLSLEENGVSDADAADFLANGDLNDISYEEKKGYVISVPEIPKTLCRLRPDLNG